MRPNGMMCQGQIRGLVVVGVLCAALAGCGSVVASNQPGGGATGATGVTGVTGVPAAASQVGCASVNQATTAIIHRGIGLVEPANSSASTVTQRKATVVRALFGELCNAVTHPYTSKQVIRCPADFGASYLGTFYDGTRVLATFTYAASGCQRVTVTAAGKTQGTMMYGRAAAAAPHLVSDLDAAVGLPQPGAVQPAGPVNPGGPNKPA